MGTEVLTARCNCLSMPTRSSPKSTRCTLSMSVTSQFKSDEGPTGVCGDEERKTPKLKPTNFKHCAKKNRSSNTFPLWSCWLPTSCVRRNIWQMQRRSENSISPNDERGSLQKRLKESCNESESIKNRSACSTLRTWSGIHKRLFIERKTRNVH